AEDQFICFAEPFFREASISSSTFRWTSPASRCCSRPIFDSPGRSSPVRAQFLLHVRQVLLQLLQIALVALVRRCLLSVESPLRLLHRTAGLSLPQLLLWARRLIDLVDDLPIAHVVLRVSQFRAQIRALR